MPLSLVGGTVEVAVEEGAIAAALEGEAEEGAVVALEGDAEEGALSPP